MRLDVVIFHFYIFGLFLFLVIKKIKTLADQLISATSRAAREAWPKGRQVLSAVALSAALIRLLRLFLTFIRSRNSPFRPCALLLGDDIEKRTHVEARPDR